MDSYSHSTCAILMLVLPMVIWVIPIAAVPPLDFSGDIYCNAFYTYNFGISTDGSTYLNVDTAFGTLPYSTARFIDIIWDIGFARCGQALIGWITYRVNTSALLRIMETRPVSYELFSTLSLSWSSVASLEPVIRAFFWKLGFRKKLILLWIILNIFWVGFWPTFTSAMTGYIPQSNTFVKLKGEDGYVNYTDIGSISNLAFQMRENQTVNGTQFYANLGPVLLNSGPNTTLWSNLYQNLQSRAAQDADGFYNPIQLTPTDYFAVFYSYQNEIYTNSYFSDLSNIQCVATGVYQWGFSSLITFFFMGLNLLWVIGTYGVWTHMNRKSALCRKGRRLGKYRAAIDLVESINRDLGKDICAYTESELKDELKKQDGIRYFVADRDGDVVQHIGISSTGEAGKVRLRFGVPYGRAS